jgi:hypothetical protein
MRAPASGPSPALTMMSVGRRRVIRRGWLYRLSPVSRHRSPTTPSNAAPKNTPLASQVATKPASRLQRDQMLRIADSCDRSQESAPGWPRPPGIRLLARDLATLEPI